MKAFTAFSASIFAAGLLWSGVAFGSQHGKAANCDPAKTPASVDARVVKIDSGQGKVTVRDNNGNTHEFQASKETLQDLKVGDRIEAKLRSAPNC